VKPPAGWVEIDTGGNCTAWQRDLSRPGGVPGAYALLTQAGDPSAPVRRGDRVVLGIYAGPDDRQVVAFEFPRLADALRALAGLAFIQEVEL